MPAEEQNVPPYRGKEQVTLHAPGMLPGIAGAAHGPGVFLVDWDARTITEVRPSAPVDDRQQEDAPLAASPESEAAAVAATEEGEGGH